MKTKKRRMEFISFYDHTGLEKHFAKMARKGWLIEGISNLYWTYRKIEPQDLHFCVTYYPKASDFDPEPTEGQQRLLDFCAHTGWKLCCTWFQMQVFYNEQENPVPLETDPVLEIETLHKACKKNFLPSHFILAALGLLLGGNFLGTLSVVPITVLSQSSRILTGIAWLCMVAISGVELFTYFLWHRKAVKMARDGIFVDTVSTTKYQMGIMVVLMIAVVWWLTNLFAADDPMLFWVAVLMLTYTVGLMLLVNGIKKGLKKAKASRGTNKALTIIACFVLSFAMTGIVTGVVLSAVNAGLLEPNPKTEEIPLSLSDLMEIKEEEYEVGTEFQQTVFLGHRTVHHRPDYSLKFSGAVPDLLYTVTTVKVPVFYEWCKDQYLEGRLMGAAASKDVGYDLTEATPWGAEEAYRQLDKYGNPKTSFLLFYEKTIVLIHFDWEPTRSQMAIVAEKLGS